jgi:DNA polymerase-3 subunit delta
MAVYLLTGNDESILRAAVQDLVTELVGDGDRALMVDEFDGEEYELRLAVDAAQTPPFLTDRRVVVARSIDRFDAAELTPLLDYLANPLDTSDLVLVVSKVAKALSDAVKRGGTIVNTSPPARPQERQSWVADRVSDAGVRMRPDAIAKLAAWLGEDVGRLDGVLATLTSTYGTDRALAFDDVEPFLGDAGGVPPWDFTDAIDAGDTTKALTMLGRMMNGGGRHPLVVIATLHKHYVDLARLDGLGARSEADASAATGLKGYPAKKALANYNRLGGSSVKRAVELLAQADLDLRGDTDLDDELIMEVLVARLSKLRR